MGTLKVPGPDGFQGVFYHSFWDIISREVNGMEADFMNGRISLRRLNSTNIVLIPKTQNPELLRKVKKSYELGIKLDMNKAYDLVEWDILMAVMVKMGFDSKWVDLVMSCVTIVEFLVLINGQPVRRFRPS
ncbi:uncharacterized protein [Malus domestica]|uniref:uncharacterized protein n=1 Tax=Malus domestica TaxID=3750 RepID=UPI0039757A9C